MDLVVNPDDPMAVRADRLARELLGARLECQPGPDNSLLNAAMTAALREVTAEPSLVPYMLAAQVALSWELARAGAVAALIKVHLDQGWAVEDEDDDIRDDVASDVASGLVRAVLARLALSGC